MKQTTPSTIPLWNKWGAKRRGEDMRLTTKNPKAIKRAADSYCADECPKYIEPAV
jgi:hypothetical protein